MVIVHDVEEEEEEIWVDGRREERSDMKDKQHNGNMFRSRVELEEDVFIVKGLPGEARRGWWAFYL